MNKLPIIKIECQSHFGIIFHIINTMLKAELRKLLQVGLVLLWVKVYDIELFLLPAVYLSLVHRATP